MMVYEFNRENAYYIREHKITSQLDNFDTCRTGGGKEGRWESCDDSAAWRGAGRKSREIYPF